MTEESSSFEADRTGKLESLKAREYSELNTFDGESNRLVYNVNALYPSLLYANCRLGLSMLAPSNTPPHSLQSSLRTNDNSLQREFINQLITQH